MKRNEHTQKKPILCGSVARVILLILTIASALWLVQLPSVDDVPYYEAVEDQVADYGDFHLSDATEHGTIEADAFTITPGEGEKMFLTDVSLSEGELFQVSFEIENRTEEVARMTVDLYGPGYDLSGMETTFDIAPGNNSYTVILPYYRCYRPSECALRFITPYDTDLSVQNLRIDRMISVVGGNRLVKVTTVAAGVLFVLFAFLLFRNLVYFLRERKGTAKKRPPLREVLMYFCITGIVLVILLILYRRVDITCPIDSSGDAMGVHYYAKLIDENGISLVGHRTGGLSGADMYDYPYSDTLSFLLVKGIGLFTDNPYLIINLFYFLCYFFTANISAACMRYLKVGRIPTVAMSVLYAFSPYIQQRYGHMWLVPYFLMPVACVLAIDIMRDTLHASKDPVRQRSYFSKMLLLAFCCAFTGLYYAFFACALITVGMVILWLNRPEKGFRQYLYPLGYLGAVLSGVVTNVIPNVVYHLIHGPNHAGDLEMRTAGEAEAYGLKLVQMLLPQRYHRIKLLAKLTEEYGRSHPLVNENSMAALGLIGSVGLVLSLIFLFCRKWEKEISYLNIAMILIGTVGGISSVLTVVMDIPIRCYNRICVVILFLSLLQIAMLLEALAKRIPMPAFAAIAVGLTIIGVYDQTYTNPPVTYAGSSYEYISNIVGTIEDRLPEGSYIYQIPFTSWPTGNGYRNFYGYIESEKLHWSYGAMQGREESEWQKHVEDTDMASMIRQIKEAGYAGIYLDTNTYFGVYNTEIEPYLKELEAILGKPAVEEEYGYGTIYFWNL